MIGLIYNTANEASRNIASHIIGKKRFEKHELMGKGCFRDGEIVAYEVGTELFKAQEVDTLGFEVAYFLSTHRSAKGIPALTTHSEGNWGSEAGVGGKPRELSFSAPVEMLQILRSITKISAEGVEKTYEATHHGPLLKTPSMFVELGGNADTIANKNIAALLGDAVYDTLTDKENWEYSKVVIGIGGTHYPSKFTKLALEKGYAFSHIMPRHAIVSEDGSDNLEVLGQAATRAKDKPEAALIDWKSVNQDSRTRIIKKLDEIGMDWERV